MLFITDSSKETEKFKRRLFSDFGSGIPIYYLRVAPSNREVDYVLQRVNTNSFIRNIDYNPIEVGTSKDPIHID